jgi:hypothetical protein
MKITAGRWQKKTTHKKLNSHGLLLSMVTGKHYAKPDPKNFQSKLLGRYEIKLVNIMREFESSLAQ